jgi:ribonuclease R
MQYKQSFEKNIGKEKKENHRKHGEGNAQGGQKGKQQGNKQGSRNGREQGSHKARGSELFLSGVFQSHVRGFGFVTVQGLSEDLYIPAGKTGNAFYGDTVEVRILSGADPEMMQQIRAIHEAEQNGTEIPQPERSKGGKSAKGAKDGHRTEAEVVRVLAHGITKVVGTYTKEAVNGYVTPDNSHIAFDFFVRNENSMHAVTGHKVVMDITDYGTAAKNPEGRITEILGHMDDPGVDILSIIRANDLPEDFPDDVKREVEMIPDHVEWPVKKARGKQAAAETPGQFEDLRKLIIVTIDGEDTKDIDDAISLTKKGKNWELGVHIADVSHYVTEGSPLDKEALSRGNSIYLVDRVIPMLPHELSNGICSLNEGEDRFALSCLMTINAKGETVDYRITESVIRSNARLTYTGVHRLLSEDDNSEIEEHLKRQHVRFYKMQAGKIAAMLKEMGRLSEILTKVKEKRGAIDFEFQESKIVLDEQGHPIDIHPYERTEATELIENFMLKANETVAMHCAKAELPFVYRSHTAPDPEKIRQLSQFMKNLWTGRSGKTAGLRALTSGAAKNGTFGRNGQTGGSTRGRSRNLVPVGGTGNGMVNPRQIQQLLRMIKGTPEEATLSRMTLRSMQQAQYTTDCEGHFGLALKYYCHFTSPIRRYADLQIHRIIRESIAGGGKLEEQRSVHYQSVLPYVAKHTSEMERRADDAERQTDKQKKCEYMAGRLGEEYEGVVSGVTGWGLYIELPDTVEGLVPIAALFDDYYDYDEEKYILIGEHSGRTYGLGQKVKVKVAAVDIVSRTIDFALADASEKSAPEADGRSERRSESRSRGGQKPQDSARKKNDRGGQKPQNNETRGQHTGRKRHNGGKGTHEAGGQQ